MKTKRISAIDRSVDRLYKAVQHYVKQRGGNLVVVGGIEIQQWPGDDTGKFRVAVRCLGKLPKAVQS